MSILPPPALQNQRRQGVYWMGTIPSPDDSWTPHLPNQVLYLKGQLEEGEGGYVHHQVYFITKGKKSLAQVCALWAPIVGHWELTRSDAAEAYVWKEETRIGEPYDLGIKPLRRNSATDWEVIKRHAQRGELEEIPGDVYIRFYIIN